MWASLHLYMGTHTYKHLYTHACIPQTYLCHFLNKGKQDYSSRSLTMYSFKCRSYGTVQATHPWSWSPERGLVYLYSLFRGWFGRLFTSATFWFSFFFFCPKPISILSACCVSGLSGFWDSTDFSGSIHWIWLPYHLFPTGSELSLANSPFLIGPLLKPHLPLCFEGAGPIIQKPRRLAFFASQTLS